MGQSIHRIKEQYEPFALDVDTGQGSGWAAYYIYTNTRFILPDGLDHYYYLEYNEQGIVYRVYDGVQKGG